MNQGAMTQQVEAAIADEQRHHRVRDIIMTAARLRGHQPSDNELDDAVRFVVDYIRHVPLLLGAMDAASVQIGAQTAIKPLLDSCERYWHEGLDVIPDHLGLAGYADDAYYVLSILQAIAERHRTPNGVPLMDLQLTAMNQTMRVLIGEPHATILDIGIAAALTTPALNAMVAGLPAMGVPLVDRDPIWGNASIDDIVKVRLGALGVF